MAKVYKTVGGELVYARCPFVKGGGDDSSCDDRCVYFMQLGMTDKYICAHCLAISKELLEGFGVRLNYLMRSVDADDDERFI